MTLVNLFTVCATGEVWDGDGSTGGSSGAVGAGVSSLLYNWQPVNYPAGGLGATAISLNDSVAAGVTELISMINAHPGPFALVGESQGAMVVSTVLQELQAGSLTARMSDLMAGVTFGNDMREQGHTFPHDPGHIFAQGHGISAANLTNTPDLWYDFCTPNDVAANSPIGSVGVIMADLFDAVSRLAWQISSSADFFTHLANAVGNAADGISQSILALLTNPLNAGAVLDRTVVWAYSCVVNLTTSGHQSYPTYQVTPGVTYIDIAIDYLNGTLPPPSSDATMFYLEGTTVNPSTDAGVQNSIMSGAYDGSFSPANGYTNVWINYPSSLAPLLGTDTLGASIAVAVAELDAAIKSTPGPKVLVGFSQGAMAIDVELTNLIDDPDAPPANELTCLLAGDPLRPGGLIHRFFPPGQTIPILDFEMIAPPDSQYDVVVLAQQYDGMADYPDLEPSLMQVFTSQHPIAVANAALGFLVLHCNLSSLVGSPPAYQFSYPPPGSPTNTTVCPNGGTVRTYLLPTDPLPLVVPLPGFAWSIASLIIRPLVDAGYDRSARNYAIT